MLRVPEYRLRAAIALAVFSLVACSERQSQAVDASAMLRAVPELATHADVMLPLTVKEVLKQRPTATQTDFGGQEVLRGVTLHYIAERGPSSEPVPASAKVTAVSAGWKGEAGDAPAVARFIAFRQRYSDFVGTSPACFEHIVPPSRGVVIARWTVAGGGIDVWRRLAQPHNSADVLIIVWSGEFNPPSKAAAKSVPCS